MKIFKRIAMAATAAAVLCSVPFMAACSSDHPEATITIQFNQKTYELKYKLYRNMYPQTVKHFIELADAGFYDNTIIHSYESSYFYGGGYTYNDAGYESNYETDYEEDEGAMREYFEANSKERAYYELATSGKLTPSVYGDYLTEAGGYQDPLPTVIGEVGDTHVIQNGKLTGGFGALRMFYSQKELEDGDVVYLDKDGNEDGVLFDSYLEHSATSIFSIQTSTSSGSSAYCIFGQLIETDTLSDLIDAISDDAEDKDITGVPVDQYDQIIGDRYTNYDDFTVTSLPIVVVSVEITKY